MSVTKCNQLVLKSNIIEEFLQYGLTPTEARVYVNLIKLGPQSAGTLSRTLGIERTQVYRTLKALLNKGFVTILLGDPVIYSAKSVRESLTYRILHYKEQLKKMETKIDPISRKIEKELKNLSVVGQEEPQYRLNKGRENFLKDLMSSITKARSYILRVHTANALKRTQSYGLIDIYRQKVNSGVKLISISTITPKNLLQAKAFASFSTIYHLPEVRISFQVVDGIETILSTNYRDDSSSRLAQDIYIYTNDRTFAEAFSLLFRHLLNSSVPAEYIIKKIVDTDFQHYATAETKIE